MLGRKVMLVMVLAAGAAALFLASRSILREYRRNQQIEQQIEGLKAEAEKLRQENGDLSQRIAYFETPAFQEKAAKDKLNLQMEDENVVIIKSSPGAAAGNRSSAVEGKASEDEKIPNYLKWWQYFFE